MPFVSPMDISLNSTVRVYLTSRDTPMQGPPRGRHVYVVGLLHRRGRSIGNIARFYNRMEGGADRI